jgi:hypothetical protein
MNYLFEVSSNASFAFGLGILFPLFFAKRAPHPFGHDIRIVSAGYSQSDSATGHQSSVVTVWLLIFWCNAIFQGDESLELFSVLMVPVQLRLCPLWRWSDCP